MDYCMTSLHKREREQAFQYYITDALKIIAENTAKYVGGPFIPTRFYDIMNPPPEAPKSADIISRIKNKMRGGAIS